MLALITVPEIDLDALNTERADFRHFFLASSGGVHAITRPFGYLIVWPARIVPKQNFNVPFFSIFYQFSQLVIRIIAFPEIPVGIHQNIFPAKLRCAVNKTFLARQIAGFLIMPPIPGRPARAYPVRIFVIKQIIQRLADIGHKGRFNNRFQIADHGDAPRCLQRQGHFGQRRPLPHSFILGRKLNAIEIAIHC